jgi:hypothetical protein
VLVRSPGWADKRRPEGVVLVAEKQGRGLTDKQAARPAVPFGWAADKPAGVFGWVAGKPAGGFG